MAWTSCSSVCRTRRAWRSPRSSSAGSGASSTCRPPTAQGPLAYPRWYGFEHDQPDLLAEAVYGLPERHREQLRAARLVATPGCYVDGRHAGAGAAARRRTDRASWHRRRCRQRGVRRRPARNGRQRVLRRRRGLHGLRAARPSPHPGDRAEPRRRGPLHAPPGPDEPGHPGDVLRPPDGERRTVDGLAAGRAATTPTPTSRSSSSRRQPVDEGDARLQLAHLTVRYDERTGWIVAICALDNLTKGASGGALQSANVALGLDERAGLPALGLAP